MNLKYKSVLALGMSAAMMMQAPVVAFANETVPQSDATSEIGYGVGDAGFNVVGKDSNSSDIQTTFRNQGYATYQDDNTSSKIQGSSAFSYGTEYAGQTGITTKITAEAKTIEGAGNDEVHVTYTVTNTGNEAKEVKIGSGADTKIGEVDCAPIGFINDGTGIYMKGDRVSFTLTPLSDQDNFSTVWYGDCGYVDGNIFNQQENQSEFNGDSGMAYSWTINVGAGETETRTAVFKIGNIVLRQISYDANTGIGEIAGTTVIGGTSREIVIKKNAGEMTKEGYKFAGWGLSENAKSAKYKGGETIDLGMLENDLKLYALWQLIKASNPSVTIEEVAQMVEEEISNEGINIITTEAGEALPTTELGNAEAVTKSVSLDLSKVAPAQYVETIKNTVQAVPTQGVAVIETNEVATFDKNIIEAMAERNDVSYIIVFKHDGFKKKVVIPAGYDVQSLLDENGYCGFLRLAAILGFTIIE
ncbi:InlB B-repeat-containing protein [Butyrivibrio sp. VCB2001]|uniref:InlB B-repeat-containing protein n=1 Tax=Butyrivibrio sp. VCB2001 TaxID=1280667 RepID=UPI00041AD502|nr:InlB B-repeat-containing protein [Butyrivibrio sp. VCB2001]